MNANDKQGAAAAVGANETSCSLRHELRTPLNQIIGYSELLIEEAADRGQADLVPDLEKIRAAGSHLLGRINELLAGADPPTPGAAMAPPLRFFALDTPSSPPKIGADFRSHLSTAPNEQASATRGGRLLVVDDNPANRDMLSRRLERDGHTVATAADGHEALVRIAADTFDLILLDIMMPGMDGITALEHIKADPSRRHLPVIMISALDELEIVVRCIERGAEDYLPKPFNPTLLRARIAACLERKRLRDREVLLHEELISNYRKLQELEALSERLLRNILPELIMDRLRTDPSVIAEHFSEVTVLFADIVDFTLLSSQMAPEALVLLLNDVFLRFDQLTEKHGLEKIKTIGDAYMVVGGLPAPRADHVVAVAELALDMLDAIECRNRERQESVPLRLRVGIHTGPVVAGVIGARKFAYDLWGHTVNLASRMESHGEAGAVQITHSAYLHLCHRYEFEPRGPIPIKGQGEMTTYLLRDRKRYA